MSTKIVDLSDTESDISIEEERKPKRQVGRKKKYEEDFDNYKVLKYFLYKTKDPILVTFIMMFLTNKLLNSGINRIPGIESVNVNIILSILAGIIFFFIRELF